MSALNVFVSDDAVDIFTDGAVYAADGKIGGFMSKVVLCPTIGGVVAAVGAPATDFLLMGLIGDGNLGDLEAIEASLGEIVKTAAEAAPAAFGFLPFEFVVAGLDSNGGARAVHFASTSQPDGRRPFEPKSITKFVSPMHGSLVNLVSNFNGTPEAGLRIMQEQRGQRFQPAGLVGEVFAVGGFCQHTRTTKEGVTVRVLKRWPDVIGEKIEPG